MGFDSVTDVVIGTFDTGLSQGQSQPLMCYDTYDVSTKNFTEYFRNCKLYLSYTDGCHTQVANWKKFRDDRMDPTDRF